MHACMFASNESNNYMHLTRWPRIYLGGLLEDQRLLVEQRQIPDLDKQMQVKA